MAEELGKLSSEDIAKLERTISEARDLSARQEEILKNVITYEDTIGKTRISYLNDYFDTYSKRLDDIARKTSKLDDSFLILERRAAEQAAATSERNDNAKKQEPTGSKSGNKKGSKNKSVNAVISPVSVDQTLPNDARGRLKETSEADIKIKLEKYSRFLKNNIEERDNILLEEEAYKTALNERYSDQRARRLQEQAHKATEIENTIMDLANQRLNAEEEVATKITDLRLSQQQSTLSAELATQSFINTLNAEIEYATNPDLVEERWYQKSQQDDAEYKLQEAKALSDEIAKYQADQELYYRSKNNGKLRESDAKKIAEETKKRYKDLEKNEEALSKRRGRLAQIEYEKNKANNREETLKGINALTAKGASFAERRQAFDDLTRDSSGNFDGGKALNAALLAISNMAKQLEDQIDKIASYKGFIDTRLQGSNNETVSGSYWDQLVHDMTSVGAINPYFKQEDFANNIKSLVDTGIAFDLKQRAFLMTIQEKIANTFEVADGTLLRLVRIQQEDSTAGRLGMESALNSFLNNMYENTEYLKKVADSVRGSLEEMESLMSGAEAAEVEFQVQKWLGSLYSVGMSQGAVQGISDALGKIGAGQIDGLTSGGAGNLLIMAANDAGLSIADILTDGINSSDTNKLLQATVNYLAELADSAKDNNVVQQQLANVFGVKASDLRAATNLATQGTTSSIYGSSMSYSDMLGQLYAMAGSMGKRTSLAEMMSNVWKNGEYTIAGSMASNPISYFIYKTATLLDDTAGGIAIPAISTMFGGVDLETTVADLMRVAAVGTGVLGSFGSIVSGLSNSFDGQRMLSSLGIKSGSNLVVTPRGGIGLSATPASGGLMTTSESAFVYTGNASGSDLKESTLQEAEDSKKQHMIEAKEEEGASEIDILNTSVVKIYELLDDVVHGNSSFRVNVDNYGLTKTGGNNAAQSLGSAATGLGGNTNDTESFGGGPISVGGWTTI